MAWTQISPKSKGRMMHGESWLLFPALSLNKTSVALNRVACDTYDLKVGDKISVLIDTERRAIGFRKVKNPEDMEFAFTLTTTANDGRKAPSLKFACRQVIRTFPDAIGKAYRLSHNGGDGQVIEAELTGPNCITGM